MAGDRRAVEKILGTIDTRRFIGKLIGTAVSMAGSFGMDSLGVAYALPADGSTGISG